VVCPPRGRGRGGSDRRPVLFARDLHVLLAVLTTFTLAVATVEGVVRAVRGRPAGVATERTRGAVLLVVGMNVASGLALLVGGHRPGEWLHLVYAVLAFGLVPVADNAATSLGSDRGKALARVGGGLVCLVVITRLFQTG
jgi:hypothetical protein